MKKIILIPDSFKGTMSSQDICEIMGRSLEEVFPQAQIISVPVADGGEGSVDAFLAAIGGEKKYITVQGPYAEPVESFYGLIGKIAVVEMAAAAGLPMVGENRHAEKTTTYGVGQLMKHAADNPSVKRLILGLGGSATNDGGCGAAAALGIRFYDSEDVQFVPVGETLCQIARIDVSQVAENVAKLPITIMCDIDNPLCGANGAAAVFGPQKGADLKTVQLLDDGLRHLAAVVQRDLQTDILDLPGAGAAGGMGGGMVGFLGAKLQMGIETVLETVGFDQMLTDTNMVFTGEGRIDGQSLRGKVVVGVARHARQQAVPVIAVVGDIADGAEQAYAEGVTAIFSINRLAVPYAQAKHTAKEDLRLTMMNLARIISHNM